MISVGKYWAILDLTFVVIFNALFWGIGDEKVGNSDWISYFFVHIAYIMLLITRFFIVKSRSIAVYGFSLYYLSGIYFLFTLLLNSILILFFSEVTSFGLSSNLIALSIFLITFIGTYIANVHSAEKEKRHYGEVLFMKTMAYDVKSIIESQKKLETKKLLEKLYDAVKNSPTKSVIEAKELEDEIQKNIINLKEDVHKSDPEKLKELIGIILSRISKRNSIIKIQN